MSGLFDPFLPKSVQGLAFASPVLAKVANAMASGQLHDHLLLHGDPGCGKSHLASLVVGNRYPQLSLKSRTYEGVHWDSSALAAVQGQMNWDRANGIDQHYTIINEVDQMVSKELEKLKAFMDNATDMKFVMTMNNPTKLSTAFLNRANAFHMTMMPTHAAVPIVQQAALSLGKTASPGVAAQLIGLSSGSWRTLERHVRNL